MSPENKFLCYQIQGEHGWIIGVHSTLGQYNVTGEYEGVVEMVSWIDVLKLLIQPLHDDDHSTQFWVYTADQIRTLGQGTENTVYNNPVYCVITDYIMTEETFDILLRNLFDLEVF